MAGKMNEEFRRLTWYSKYINQASGLKLLTFFFIVFLQTLLDILEINGFSLPYQTKI